MALVFCSQLIQANLSLASQVKMVELHY